MVSSKHWLLNLRLRMKTARIYNKHKKIAHTVIKFVPIGERLWDINHPASLLKNLPSLQRLVQNKQKRNLIWGCFNSAKRVCRDKIHNSTQEQAPQKGHSPVKKSHRVAQDSIIARIRYHYSMSILCNLQE